MNIDLNDDQQDGSGTDNTHFHDNPLWLGLLIIVVLLALLFLIGPVDAKQTQPDSRRLHEIQLALVDHGFLSGHNWAETQIVLRAIARQHHWQTQHAPDARVLILLGLGNKHSNADVLDWPPSRLEGGDPDGDSTR